jgi:YfiH family protein
MPRNNDASTLICKQKRRMFELRSLFPSTTHTWHWRTWQGAPYLTCSLLESWPHGFFTQAFWPRPPEELITVLSASATVHRVKQVHGNRVLSPSEIATSESSVDSYPPADAVMTETACQSAWVCSADCNPVLIADQVTGQVAAVHAGWRGTAQQIVPATVARLLDQGSRLEDLRVAMGPAIAGEVYQVSNQVAAEVGSTIANGYLASGDALVDHLKEQAHSPVLPDAEPGRAKLDVRRVNALQLEQLGLAPEQIAIAPHCTYREPELFFSYRRSKEKKVQWSGIVSV